MKPHKHAELMKQYYEDALETETPWERWEYRYGVDKWITCSVHPVWDLDKQYRRKPVALCQVEGRDVFPGDKLWHIREKMLMTVEGLANTRDSLHIAFYGTAYINNLTWTEPAKTKTVYQWAMRQGDRWFCSSTMVADKVEMVANFPNFTDFRRLDWTALEVPA